MKRIKEKAGFTLVELIVVIAILGILTAIAVPTYSGYVKKANSAADATLLDSINTAFAAACIENEIDVYTVTASEATIDIADDGTWTPAMMVDGEDLTEAFKAYMGSDTGSAFKVYRQLAFSGGMFVVVEGGSTYTNLMNTIRDALGSDKITDAANSNLGKLGTEKLFAQMNGAMDTASELNLHTLTGEPFLNAFAGYLGVDPNDSAVEEKYAAAIENLGVSAETAMTHAIALYAAQSSASVTTDRLSQWLGGDTTTDDLQSNANANTLADTAAIYGLYLSYNQKNGVETTGNTLDTITAALTDDAFASWVSTDPVAQEELEAYQTYMNIINEAAKDESARNDILANGFNNAEMQELMKELMGN